MFVMMEPAIYGEQFGLEGTFRAESLLVSVYGATYFSASHSPFCLYIERHV